MVASIQLSLARDGWMSSPTIHSAKGLGAAPKVAPPAALNIYEGLDGGRRCELVGSLPTEKLRLQNMSVAIYLAARTIIFSAPKYGHFLLLEVKSDSF